DASPLVSPPDLESVATSGDVDIDVGGVAASSVSDAAVDDPVKKALQEWRFPGHDDPVSDGEQSAGPSGHVSMRMAVPQHQTRPFGSSSQDDENDAHALAFVQPGMTIPSIESRTASHRGHSGVASQHVTATHCGGNATTKSDEVPGKNSPHSGVSGASSVSSYDGMVSQTSGGRHESPQDRIPASSSTDSGQRVSIPLEGNASPPGPVRPADFEFGQHGRLKRAPGQRVRRLVMLAGRAIEYRLIINGTFFFTGLLPHFKEIGLDVMLDDFATDLSSKAWDIPAGKVYLNSGGIRVMMGRSPRVIPFWTVKELEDAYQESLGLGEWPLVVTCNLKVVLEDGKKIGADMPGQWFRRHRSELITRLSVNYGYDSEATSLAAWLLKAIRDACCPS
ncbi:hypothetical protein FN846DRAFT_982556, partial [Sphaerosporella brunnea]